MAFQNPDFLGGAPRQLPVGDTRESFYLGLAQAAGGNLDVSGTGSALEPYLEQDGLALSTSAAPTLTRGLARMAGIPGVWGDPEGSLGGPWNVEERQGIRISSSPNSMLGSSAISGLEGVVVARGQTQGERYGMNSDGVMNNKGRQQWIADVNAGVISKDTRLDPEATFVPEGGGGRRETESERVDRHTRDSDRRTQQQVSGRRGSSTNGEGVDGTQSLGGWLKSRKDEKKRR